MELTKDWKDIEYKKIKEKSWIKLFESFIEKILNWKYCISKFSFKLFSLPFKYCLYFFIYIILFIYIFNPYLDIYTAFKSDNSDLLLNNKTYYDIFTEINEGIDYDSDKEKLKISSILNSIISTLFLTIFFISPILVKINSKIFLVIYLFLNTSIFAINIYDISILGRLDQSYNEYIYMINRKFAEKDKDIIPFDKFNGSTYGINGNFLHILFSLMNYVLIFYIFYAKRRYEKGVYNSPEKNNEYEEQLNK